MAIKLIKACKELNIGMSTAVEFCKKQGKEIAMDPNIRIEDDLYLLLAKEFNKDMAFKLEAERQAQERQEQDIPKSVAIEEPKSLNTSLQRLLSLKWLARSTWMPIKNAKPRKRLRV